MNANAGKEHPMSTPTNLRDALSEDETGATARELIQAAADGGYTLCGYANEVDDATVGLSVQEAVDIAAVDPSLVYWI